MTSAPTPARPVEWRIDTDGSTGERTLELSVRLGKEGGAGPCAGCPALREQVASLEKDNARLESLLQRGGQLAQLAREQGAAGLAKGLGDRLDRLARETAQARTRVAVLEERERTATEALAAERAVVEGLREEVRRLELRRANNGAVGAHGEREVEELIRAALGEHVRVHDTSKKPNVGDLRVEWGAATVMVEVKTSKGAARMVPDAYVRQARERLEGSGCDAGLLCYTGAVSSGRSVVVDEGERLVLCGFTRRAGQVGVALLHALLIARQRAEARRRQRDELRLSPSDLAELRVVLKGFAALLGSARGEVNALRAAATKAMAEQKEKATTLAVAVEALAPNVRAALFPPTFLQRVSVAREKLAGGSKKNKKGVKRARVGEGER